MALRASSFKGFFIIFPNVLNNHYIFTLFFTNKTGQNFRRKIRNLDSGIKEIFLMWNLESWALESGIQLNESGIYVPLTENLESSAWNPESPA